MNLLIFAPKYSTLFFEVFHTVPKTIWFSIKLNIIYKCVFRMSVLKKINIYYFDKK